MLSSVKLMLVKYGLTVVLKQALKQVKDKYLTNSVIKDVLHSGNAKLAEKVQMEGQQAAVKYGQELMALGQMYINAWADDGKMDENEVKAINAKCDAMVDEYLPNSRLALWTDTAFIWVDALMEKIFRRIK